VVTVIGLSGRSVQAVVGKRKGKRVIAEAVYHEYAPEKSIINGQVTREEVFTDFLRAFWGKHRLAKKNVTLVIGSARTVTKVLLLPPMSSKRLMEYLPREFTFAGNAGDSVYTYTILGRENGKNRVFAAMVEREFLECHIRRFLSLGIHVKAVSIGIMADIGLLCRAAYMRDETCAVQSLCDRNLVTMLFVKGQYYHSISTRMFGKRGTADFGMEAARAADSIRQFLYSWNHEEKLSHVYLGSGFGEEDLEICQKCLRLPDDGPEVLLLYPEEKGMGLWLDKGVDRSIFSFYFTELAGLTVPDGRGSLMYQLTHDSKKIRRREAVLRRILPAAALIAALSGVLSVEAVVWHRLADRVSGQLDYLENPRTMDRIAEYDRLAAENERLDARYSLIRKNLENIRSYPVYTSAVRQAIETCAKDKVAARIHSYDASKNEVIVEAEAADFTEFHQFVIRLEEHKEVFEKVGYDGFQYDEHTGIWASTIRCRLAVKTDTGTDPEVSL